MLPLQAPKSFLQTLHVLALLTSWPAIEDARIWSSCQRKEPKTKLLIPLGKPV